MTMTDTDDVKAPAKPRRKRAKRKLAPTTPKTEAAVKDTGEFAGMTIKDCCAACNVDACVISGKPYCAHPRKGGLHPAEMSDNGAIARRKRAENVLGKQLLEAKFT